MDHYLAKGCTFPDQDWWEENKADVSFLFTVEEEENSASSVQSCRSQKSYEVAEATERRERSEQAIKNRSKMRLDSWIEKARQDDVSATAKITSLAGYVNLAYPVMKILAKKKRGYYEEMEVKDKELRRKIDRASSNLQRASETLERINLTINNARVPARQTELRQLMLRKSTKIVEKFELVNLLVNMIKHTMKTTEKELGESGQSRIYGSSVDLI